MGRWRVAILFNALFLCIGAEHQTPLRSLQATAETSHFSGIRLPHYDRECTRHTKGTATYGADSLVDAQVGWVAKFDRSTRYMHMAMIEALSNGTLFVAWQAAEMHEGVSSQHIQYTIGSVSGSHGLYFEEPLVAPISKESDGGAVWAPVLHADEASQQLWLFYAESHGKCKGAFMEWAPGGSIKAIKMDLQTGEWSSPQLVYGLHEDRGIPKVIANKVLVLDTGEWVLPFWRERALLDWGPVCRHLDGDGSAGVLISTDRGATWEPHGKITDNQTWLIENAVAQLGSGELVMTFRSEVGCVYLSRSWDRGRSWSAAQPLRDLANPDSKADLGAVGRRGPLVLAFNDHRRLRTDLRIALSLDGSRSWHQAANVERAGENSYVHYPTIQVYGCYLFVAYSRFFKAGTEERSRSGQQGIRVAAMNLFDLAASTQAAGAARPDAADPEHHGVLGSLYERMKWGLGLGEREGEEEVVDEYLEWGRLIRRQGMVEDGEGEEKDLLQRLVEEEKEEEGGEGAVDDEDQRRQDEARDEMRYHGDDDDAEHVVEEHVLLEEEGAHAGRLAAARSSGAERGERARPNWWERQKERDREARG